jgi:hypothetical protein
MKRTKNILKKAPPSTPKFDRRQSTTEKRAYEESILSFSTEVREVRSTNMLTLDLIGSSD